MGHTPPGWWTITENPLDDSEKQMKGQSSSGARYVLNYDKSNERWMQGPFCRWQQDEPTSSYSTPWQYHANNPQDAGVGRPTFIEYKFRLIGISPTTPYKRTGLLIHPDGKKDGTLGCIGIQSYNECKGVAIALRNYHGLKIKIELK